MPFTSAQEATHMPKAIKEQPKAKRKTFESMIANKEYKKGMSKHSSSKDCSKR